MSMEQNRIRPVKSGKSVRMSYSRQKEVLEMPNLIEIQKDSYEWFLKDGLKAGLYSEVSEDVIRPSAEECNRNPRARSTKMRWAIKAE